MVIPNLFENYDVTKENLINKMKINSDHNFYWFIIEINEKQNNQNFES